MSTCTSQTCRVPDLIGMLHVPINTILTGSVAWQQKLGLPCATDRDWSLVDRLPAPDGASDSMRDQALADVRALSFHGYLQDRLLAEASLYWKASAGCVMMENIAAPYCVRGQQPPVVYWVMRALVERLQTEHPDVHLGIQILAYSDDWAMDIACRCGLDFIRCESALFEGVRPEGRTPNAGNLAKLYMMRNRLMAQLGKDSHGPKVYVDIQKKHTVFMPALDSLDVWLDNILFQKLEGIVVTGKATGQPVEEDDLRQTRAAIDTAQAESQAAVGIAWAPPLIVGSGVSVDNIEMCKRYADAVIVGSSLKQNGFWECALDEERVARFMDAWSK